MMAYFFHIEHFFKDSIKINIFNNLMTKYLMPSQKLRLLQKNKYIHILIGRKFYFATSYQISWNMTSIVHKTNMKEVTGGAEIGPSTDGLIATLEREYNGQSRLTVLYNGAQMTNQNKSVNIHLKLLQCVSNMQGVW